MPLIRFQIASPISTLCSVGLYNSLRILQVKKYSVFPPTFVLPVYHPEQLKRLSVEEKRELLHKNIKPPQTNQNASMFHDPLLQKFINHVMQGGRKMKAREIVQEVSDEGLQRLKNARIYGAFEKLKRIQVRKFHLAKDEEEQGKISTDPLEIFHQALQNCKPVLDVIPVKRGGVVYKVPIAINNQRATSMALKWLVAISREHEPRRNHTGEFFSDRLAKELLDASQNTGKTYSKKIELHKLCEANKAYAHYRWT